MPPVKEKFGNVFTVEGRLATPNLARGFRVYGERLIEYDDIEYRLWDPYRSKLSAAIKNGLRDLPIKKGARVLYLGAASGTTASHVSDIVGEKGVVYCVEFAPRSMRDLVYLCEKRRNMLPLLADASKPEAYARDIKGRVDVIYQDVAQPTQAEILLANAKLLLKKTGSALLAIKAASVDVTVRPETIYERVLGELGEKFTLVQSINLYPYDKDHLFASLRAK